MSRRLIEKLAGFLAVTALADGDFTVRDAGVLRGICTELEGFCNELNVKQGGGWTDHPELQRPLNRRGYLESSKAEKENSTHALSFSKKPGGERRRYRKLFSKCHRKQPC